MIFFTYIKVGVEHKNKKDSGKVALFKGKIKFYVLSSNENSKRFLRWFDVK